MSDQPSGALANAARTIGSAAGKLVAAVSGKSAEPAAGPAPNANLWHAEYVGSGTFIIHKPKRQARKRRQQAVKSRRRGMRK